MLSIVLARWVLYGFDDLRGLHSLSTVHWFLESFGLGVS